MGYPKKHRKKKRRRILGLWKARNPNNSTITKIT